MWFAAAIAGAWDQPRQAQAAKGRHSNAGCEKDPVEAAAKPKRQAATEYRDAGPDEGAGSGPSHPARALPGAIERVADAKEAKKGPNRAEIDRPYGEHRRV